MDKIDLLLQEMKKNLPVISLPGSEKWSGAYDWGAALEEAFPDQDASDFCYAITENDLGPARDLEITAFVMLQQGENDGPDWIWRVTFSDQSVWKLEAGCDYTGWDCQSSAEWTRV